MEMNINEYVYVRLTKAGLKTYTKHYTDLGIAPPKLTQFGWNLTSQYSRFQLWELMNIFGPAVYHGSESQFMDNIIRFNPPE